MGFGFRKSINLGGFRINISKSGVGYSFGVPGMRFTKKANGGSRTTISVPGTGISYRKDSSAKTKTSTISKENITDNNYCDDNLNFDEIESNQNEFIDTLNLASQKNRILNSIRVVAAVVIMMGVALLASGVQNEVLELIIIGPIFIATGILSIFLVPKNAKIMFESEFDNSEQLESYNLFVEKLKLLSTSFEFYFELNGTILLPQDIRDKFDPLNKILDGELEVCCIHFKDLYLYFLPNMLVIYQDNVWKGVDYNHIIVRNIDIEKSFYNTVPDSMDTEILSSRYRYTNKDGSRNKRYKEENNPLVIECAYSKINLSSKSGLNIDLISSSRCKGEMFTAAALKFFYSFDG